MPVLWIVVLVLTGVSGTLAVLLVRDRRRLAAAQAETRQVRTLVRERVERPNIFSHEVRTPLTLIRGAAELLAEETPGPLTERQREFVSTIAVNAQQVITLAQNMLTEARIDAQLFELSLQEFDLRRLVRETVRDARRVHQSLIRLENTGAPLLVLADRALLGQALWNLVNNACRHAGDDATVTVSASRGEGQAIIAVTDDGSGMSDAERAGLFVPFAGDPDHGGTSLGMMITDRIVAQHGGRLLVATIPGHGTTVFFTIPLRDKDAERD